MSEPNDWRLTSQEGNLKGATLVWRSYAPSHPDNDHDHCEFCFAKFLQQNYPKTLQEGYSTPDRYRWICKACFDDFADLFEWKVISAT